MCDGAAAPALSPTRTLLRDRHGHRRLVVIDDHPAQFPGDAKPNAHHQDHHHAGLFIEMKSEKREASNEQRDWLARLQGAGYAIRLCRSWGEAANAILDYLALAGDAARYARFRV